MLLISSSLRSQQIIEASNSAFTYSGRFDFSNPKQVRYDWPGTSIYFQFTGKQLNFLIEGGERNFFNVFIDDELHEIMHAPNDTTYTINGIKGKGWHTCRLQKRTEGGMGISSFKGIDIALKSRVKVMTELPRRKIEFIGNSVICGYGTEGASRNEKFLPETENVNKSYAFITARAFDAECFVTAHSGLGVFRNYDGKTMATLPQRYHQTLDTDSLLTWDYNTWQPEVIVVNLGSNDYSTSVVPDRAVVIHHYRTFIKQIRTYYGNIPIFCLFGPTKNEPAYSVIKEVVRSYRQIYNDENIYFIGIPKHLLNKESDLGSDWHPSYRGHRKMASHIIPTIANVLKWNYNNSELMFGDSY